MKTAIVASPRQAAPRLRLAQFGLLTGPFLSILDSNIVSVALPAIANQLHSTLGTVQWIISGYLLALAATLAASAYLAKRFGTRRVYLISLLGFTLASALCTLSPTIGFLIAARALQGAFGAPLVPLAMSMLLGPERAERHMPPAVGIVLFLAPALGPTIGGLLLIRPSWWPLIFLINVPFGLLGALGVLRLPQQSLSRSSQDVRFDPLGIALLASGLVLAIYGATQGTQYGWTSVQALPFLVSGGILLCIYVIWALRRPHPAIDLKLLRHPQPALAVTLCALTSVVLFVMLFLIPIFLENLQGLSPLVAGLALLPQGLVTGIGTVVSRRFVRHWGVRLSVALGMVVLTLSTAALLLVTIDTPAWVTALILSGRGLALGFTILSLLDVIVANLSRDELQDGNTLFNVAERLGGSIGIPLIATFFAVRESARLAAVLQQFGLHVSIGTGQNGNSAALFSHLPAAIRTQLAQAAVGGFHDTVWLLIALSALGFCAALLLQNRRATPASPTA